MHPVNTFFFRTLEEELNYAGVPMSGIIILRCSSPKPEDKGNVPLRPVLIKDEDIAPFLLGMAVTDGETPPEDTGQSDAPLPPAA